MNEQVANSIGLLAITGCIATVVWLSAALARDPGEQHIAKPRESGADPLDPW